MASDCLTWPYYLIDVLVDFFATCYFPFLVYLSTLWTSLDAFHFLLSSYMHLSADISSLLSLPIYVQKGGECSGSFLWLCVFSYYLTRSSVKIACDRNSRYQQGQETPSFPFVCGFFLNELL